MAPVKMTARRRALLALGLLLQLSLASAFCVFNEADHPITVYQMPVGPDGQFAAVLQPGEEACCNWEDCGQYSANGAGRCDAAQFCMKWGEDDLALHTASQVLGEINSYVFHAVGVMAGVAAGVMSGTPGVGEFVGFAAGAALSEADQALQDFIDEMGCGAIVKTYNGGIAYALNEGFGGQWDGQNDDPPAGTEDCPIAGTSPTVALQQQMDAAMQTSAPVEEPAPTSSCGADQYTDLDLNGGDLYSGQMVVASSDDCCSACYADDLCWAYTFNSLNGNCFLKGEAGWTEVAYTGAYSGRF